MLLLSNHSSDTLVNVTRNALQCMIACSVPNKDPTSRSGDGAA